MGKNITEGKAIGIGSEIAREGYEASVVSRMTGRAGAYTAKGSAGNALEILANDRSNMLSLFEKGTVTKLTKSSTAKQVDAVTMRGDKVVKRIQYKETVSPSGVAKTVKQVKSGKYRQATLMGSVEATEKFNAAAKAQGVSKKMKSTGITHNTAKRVGDKFVGAPVDPACLGEAVKGSAAFAAGITAAIEIAKSVENGDSVGECVGHVVSKGSESAVSTAAATVAGETAMSVAGEMLLAASVPTAVPVAIGIGAAAVTGMVVSELTEGLFDEIGDAIGSAGEDIILGAEEAFSSAGYAISDFFDGLFSLF